LKKSNYNIDLDILEVQIQAINGVMPALEQMSLGKGLALHGDFIEPLTADLRKRVSLIKGRKPFQNADFLMVCGKQSKKRAING
jgi:hypothetical protein